MSEDRPTINVQETAERLQVHANTVRNWARDGVLTDARIPGTSFRRFYVDEVDALVVHRLGEPVTRLDPEVAAFGLIVTILERLDPPVQHRVAQWLINRYGLIP